jgi:hypothetical protein
MPGEREYAKACPSSEFISPRNVFALKSRSFVSRLDPPTSRPGSLWLFGP